MKKYVLLLFLVVFISCSSDSEEPNNSEPPTQGEEDNTPPAISISGLQDFIEVLTTLEVTVTDTSNNVNTVILLNGEEVFSTTQKSFSYELDPFDFPSGETTIIVQSKDDNDNLSEESQTFELKKLLFLWADLDGGPVSGFTYDRYLAINIEKTGELMEFKKIESEGDAIFYAPEDFEKQEIVATEYLLGKGDVVNFNLANSFADLTPGTKILTQEEAGTLLNLNSIDFTNTGTFQLSISDINLDTPINFSSLDYKATGSLTEGFNFEYDTEIASILIHSIPGDSNNMEDYRYFIIDDFVDQTVSYNSFNSLLGNEIHTINLPEGTQSFSLEIRGYLSQEQYEKDNFHQLYSLLNNNGSFGNTLDFPVLQGYEILQQRLRVSFENGKSVRANFRGLSDIEIPDLIAQRTEDQITVSGMFDYSELVVDIEGSPVPDNPNIPFFRWSYNNDSSPSISVPFVNIEIPEDVTTNLTTKGYDLNDLSSPANFNLKLTQHEIPISYQDRIFFNIQRNERGNVTEVNYNYTF